MEELKGNKNNTNWKKVLKIDIGCGGGTHMRPLSLMISDRLVGAMTIFRNEEEQQKQH